jgi:hypothetical protein
MSNEQLFKLRDWPICHCEAAGRGNPSFLSD